MSIYLFNACGIKFHINILSLPLLFICIAMGMEKLLLMTFFILSLHEFSHLMMAKRLCVRISCVELQPCGFSAIMDSKTIPLKYDIAISMSGVFFSLISGAVALTLMTVFGFKSNILVRFSQISITLGVFNLLPVLPLDGGRIFSGILNIYLPVKAARIISISIGLVMSFSVIIGGMYGMHKGILNFTVCIMGGLMLLGNISSLGKKHDESLSCMLRRSNTLLSGQSLGVATHAINENTDIQTVLSSFNSNKYNVVHVLNASMNTTAILDEGEIMYCMVSGCLNLKEAVEKNRVRGLHDVNR